MIPLAIVQFLSRGIDIVCNTNSQITLLKGTHMFVYDTARVKANFGGSDQVRWAWLSCFSQLEHHRDFIFIKAPSCPS